VEVVDESQRPATARERAAADPTSGPAALGRKGLARASTLATAAYGARGVNAAVGSARDRSFNGLDAPEGEAVGGGGGGAP
jgi:hypothetical protein